MYGGDTEFHAQPEAYKEAFGQYNGPRTRTDWEFEVAITIRCVRVNNAPPQRPSRLMTLAKAKMEGMQAQNEYKSLTFPCDKLMGLPQISQEARLRVRAAGWQ